VLNLAILSVFVVALWSYLTDVTFIYIVYILTFVSAVVMLFLSVVLMLPSSAVYISKKSSSIFLLINFAPFNYCFLLLIVL
jgi:NADH:ubiquinone oxidoreductase subunit 6 (subunit J)